ncbi:MAG: DUF72 domain-containing protein [Thiohalorhabdaceae bacterium]
MAIPVGTCGFREAQATIFADMDCLEVQRTFYQPPRVATARRWRERAPDSFRFMVKAWQLITHEASSPTYRRLREELPEDQRAECGRLRWNATTAEAWQRTQAIADALDAEAVVFQTPKSFRPSSENLANLRRFFGEADRRGRWLVFEPRGEAWADDLLADLTAELDLIHAVDPFLRAPVGEGPGYFRLHGRPAYNYRYRYSDDDLQRLAGWLQQRRSARVLFNNDTMADDARRLKALLETD